MIKSFILLLSLFLAISAQAGHETGNGGDAHMSRYLIARQFAEVIFKNITPLKSKEIFQNLDLYNVVNDNLSKWPKAIFDLQFVSTDKMLYENGREKAAISLVNSNKVLISKAYFEKYNLSIEEVIINVIHESGHKIGVSDHDKLDAIGALLVDKIFRSKFKNEEWREYLNLNSRFKNDFDKRLKAVALEYVSKGEGADLAKLVFFFSKYDLDAANLSGMFKYMALLYLKVDVSAFDENVAYGPIRDKFVNRFIVELVKYSRSISKSDAKNFIKYGMAKLKMNRVLYNDNLTNFNLLANQITDVVLDGTVSMDATVENFKNIIRNHFFIAI